MKRSLILPLLLVVAACATDPRARIMQYAEGVKTSQRATVTALDLDMIDADTGEWAQSAQRTAIAELKRAAAAVKEGNKRDLVDAILDTVEDVLIELARRLHTKEIAR